MNRNYVNLTRINRPSGIWLLMLPCFFGVFFAAQNPNWPCTGALLLLFALGSVVMRSAGCIINDIIDRRFDKEVARTKNRPLASGVLRLSQALTLLAFLLAVGLIILLQFNNLVKIAGIFALFLVILYPLMKRVTYYPQLFLGIVFNSGFLLANLEITHKITLSTVVFYSACIVWTLIYDTIYAFQDIEDDIAIGIKSSAIALRKTPKRNLQILAILQGFLLFLAGFLQKMGVFYYFFAFLTICYLSFLIQKCDYKNPQICLKTFKNNVFVGVLVLISVILG